MPLNLVQCHRPKTRAMVALAKPVNRPSGGGNAVGGEAARALNQRGWMVPMAQRMRWMELVAAPRVMGPIPVPGARRAPHALPASRVRQVSRATQMSRRHHAINRVHRVGRNVRAVGMGHVMGSEMKGSSCFPRMA